MYMNTDHVTGLLRTIKNGKILSDFLSNSVDFVTSRQRDDREI